MCGIAVIAGPHDPQAAHQMLRAIRHRGPDGEGVLEAKGCTLAVSRLAILDPLPRSDQPMSRGSQHLVYNGELYNFKELRRELERDGVHFETTGDTEVVLQALLRWGTDACRRFHGMFAFALWDERRGELWLGRDQFGIKPLFWRAREGCVVAGSECRALGGLSETGVHQGAIQEYLTFGSPISSSVFDGVVELDPGTILMWQAGSVRLENYSDDVFGGSRAAPSETFERGVREHLVSDRPVAVFLSGGFDSAAILAECTKSGVGPVGITIAHETNQMDVARAAATARHYGVDHKVVEVTAGDLPATCTEFIRDMDQPTIDGLNTYLVSRISRDVGAPVALSGLGGDEVLGGYSYYRQPAAVRLGGEIWRRLPGAVRKRMSVILSRGTGRPAHRIDAVLGASGPTDMHVAYRRLFTEEEIRRLLGSSVLELPLRRRPDPRASVRRQLAMLDFELYLRPTLLRDADIFSMASGVEVRVPFLDDRFVSAVLGSELPVTKSALAAALGDPYLSALTRERKRTFALPWSVWLPPLLTHWEAWLEDEADPWFGVIDQQEARTLLRRPSTSRDDWHRPWALLVLALWLGLHMSDG